MIGRGPDSEIDAVEDDIVVVPEARPAPIIDLTDSGTEGLGELPLGVPPQSRAARHYMLLGLALAAIDVLCLTVALVTAHSIRFGSAPDAVYVRGIAVSAVLWIGVFSAHGLYTPQHLSGPEEFRRTVSAVGIGVVLVILLTFFFDVYLARSWIALALIIAMVLELTARAVVRAQESRAHAREPLVRTLLIGGIGDGASTPIKELAGENSGCRVVGLVDLTSPRIAPRDATATELVGRLRAVIRRHRADCVVITSSTLGARQTAVAIKAARHEGAVVQVYTHLSGVWASRVTARGVGRDGVALTLRPVGLSRTQRFVKRTLDLVFAVVSIVLTLPVLLAAAVAIKATSRGPVLFRQDRVTAGGRTFPMYKLRTMTVVEERPAELRAIDTSVPFFKMKDDPRLTSVGRWLRRWSIDELPQLFNVLVGDMSLVGPRPLPVDQVDANPDFLAPRHEVRAGITGWQQINGRAELEAEESVQMDIFYIENWSPGLDLYILLRTVGVLFRREGAY